MATPALPPAADEIERRVAENDAARSTRRAATASAVGELARRHAAIAEQIADIEQQLGVLLAEADGVVTLDELAKFTDVPAATLTQWRANHKPHRTKRKKPPSSEAREQNAPTRTRNKPLPSPPTPAAPGTSPGARLASP